MLFLLWSLACSEPNIELKSISGKSYTAMLIPAGKFTMGCTSEQADKCWEDEQPAHKVTITRDYYLMQSEVTQELYESIMGSNPSASKGAKNPVESVSWFDAVTFANKLSASEGLEECYTINGENVLWKNKECKGWRLPTQAEWEKAARATQDKKYAGSDDVNEVAWYKENSKSRTNPVCGKKKNAYGLCDMSGNVTEWVWDKKRNYSKQDEINPYGVAKSKYRATLGGSYMNKVDNVRVTSYMGTLATGSDNRLGFRLARTF